MTPGVRERQGQVVAGEFAAPECVQAPETSPLVFPVKVDPPMVRVPPALSIAAAPVLPLNVLAVMVVEGVPPGRNISIAAPRVALFPLNAHVSRVRTPRLRIPPPIAGSTQFWMV